MAGGRLDKCLAEAAGLTRKEAKQAIRAGRVTVDESVWRDPDRKLTGQEALCLDGKRLTEAGLVYLLLHKPAGVVSATEDRERTVLDVLREQEEFAELCKKTELFPVGRLDKDTEGLLLLTNDGLLAHRLLSPKKHVDKEYEAVLDGIVPEDAVRRFAAGLPVGKEYVALPAKLEVREQNGTTARVRITLQEGKFHQVKRMCHEIGCEVRYLKRISMGSLTLEETLPVGQARYLTEDEIRKLKEQ